MVAVRARILPDFFELGSGRVGCFGEVSWRCSSLEVMLLKVNFEGSHMFLPCVKNAYAASETCLGNVGGILLVSCH